MINLKNIAVKTQVSKELWYHIENDISLEECVFRYDYDNEKWLTEPLMYDDDDYSVCKGMIN